MTNMVTAIGQQVAQQDKARTILFHVTSANRLESIRHEGLNAGAYLTSNPTMADYYAQVIADEGLEPVRIEVILEDLDESMLLPDMPGIEEPITTVVGLNDQAIWAAWKESAQDWRYCLELIGSIQCAQPIPAASMAIDGVRSQPVCLDEMGLQK